MRLEEHTQMIKLYCVYGKLLTERQQVLLEQYVNEDCSLFEIAEREGISRQGVRDAIHKAMLRLEGYEAALGIISRINKTNEYLEQITSIVSETEQHRNIKHLAVSITELWSYE